MYNISLNATDEQIKLLNKYISNEEINLSQELLKKAIELIEDYEDTLKALKSIKESEGKPVYTIDEILKENGIDRNEL